MRAVRVIVGAALAGISLACGSRDIDEAIGQWGSSDPPVSWEQFRSSAYKEPWPGGHFLVDGDIPLSDEAELREYYDSWREPGALTVSQVFGSGVDNLWAFPASMDLTYCIGASVGTNKSTVVDKMQAATASWSDIVGVRFVYVPEEDATCTASNADVTFDVQQVPDDNFYASAFFPNDARSSRTLSIRPAAYTATQGGRDFEGILRHELGHTLGFRHEHIWLDPTCTGEPLVGEGLDARQVTDYDVDSVMHYPQCRPSGTGGYRQTIVDYEGAAELYGLSAQLLVSSQVVLF